MFLTMRSRFCPPPQSSGRPSGRAPLTARLPARVAEELLARSMAHNHRVKRKRNPFLGNLLFTLKFGSTLPFTTTYAITVLIYILCQFKHLDNTSAPPGKHLIYPMALHPNTHLATLAFTQGGRGPSSKAMGQAETQHSHPPLS